MQRSNGFASGEGAVGRSLPRFGFASVSPAVGAACAVALALACSAPLSALAVESASPEPIWAVGFGAGGTNSVDTQTLSTVDSVNDAVQLADGGIVAAGLFDAKGVDGASGVKGGNDAALILFGADHKIKSQTLVGGSGNDSFNAVVPVSTGGYVAVGMTASSDGDLEGHAKSGKADFDGLLCKFDANGSLVKTVDFGGSGKEAFRDVVETPDGGFVAVGYTGSTDRDLSGVKSTDDRDSLVVKFNADLEVEWKKTVGGSHNVDRTFEDFVSVVLAPDGLVVAGYSDADDGDLSGLGKGKRDAVVAKFSHDGTRQWLKTYGGTLADEFASISSDSAAGDSAHGYVLAGRTKSCDGDFQGSPETGRDKAFVMRIDASGEKVFSTVLSADEGSAAESVRATPKGYVVAGEFKGSTGDFSRVVSSGGQDVYTASLALDGTVQKIAAFGGDADDSARGIAAGTKGTHLLFGHFKSSNFEGVTLDGKAQGFIAGLSDDDVLHQAQASYTIPVQAYHLTLDRESMMHNLLFNTAYVEKVGNAYKVAVYFVNADVAGNRVYAGSLGSSSYDRNGDGVLVAADSDTYDSKTQVKTVTMTLTEDQLRTPLKFNMQGMMGGGIRLKFDYDSMTEGVEPTFPEVEATASDYPASLKVVVGGAGSDVPSDMDVLANGNIMTVGSTTSKEGDFASDRADVKQSGFIAEYNSEGELMYSKTLSSASRASVLSVDGADDGSYFVSGYYQDPDNTPPANDFSSLAPGNSYGGRNAFAAKYDAERNLVWMRGLQGSGTMQYQQVKATNDGGCIALATVMLGSGGAYEGSFKDDLKGVVNIAVVKYDAQGTEQWHTIVGGAGVNDAGSGLCCLADGTYLVVGQHSASDGDFAGKEFFGGTFDLFSARLSADGKVTSVTTYGGSKDDSFSAAIPTSDGGFAFVGSTKSKDGMFSLKDNEYENSFVAKCAPTGAVEWVSTLKSSAANGASALVETAAGYTVVGTSSGSDFDFANKARGADDAFVAEFTKEGARTSLRNLGGSKSDDACQVKQLNERQLVILASSNSTDGDLKNIARGSNDGLLVFTLDRTPLVEAIGKAEAARKGAVVSADGSGLEPGAVWVTQGDVDRLDAVIAKAREVLGSDEATAESIGKTAEAVNGAVAAFDAAKRVVEKSPEGSEVWKRLAGDTALDTMASISREGWSDGCAPESVIVATMGGYWDALSSSALAGLDGAPILLTDGSELSDQTRTEIARLKPKKVYIVGGSAAVSESVRSSIEGMEGLAGRVERLAGPDAPATARAIAQEVSSRSKGSASASKTCVIATINGYYDALSVASFAYGQKAPVFLTDPSGALSDSTLSQIASAGFDKAIIVGGTAAVSGSTEGALALAMKVDANSAVKRLAGDDAWRTSQAIADFAVQNGMSADKMGVADGNGYWDALAGAALCGRNGAALVLVPHTGKTSEGDWFSYDPYCIDGFVRSNAPSIRSGYVFGGTAAVPAQTLDALNRAVGR